MNDNDFDVFSDPMPFLNIRDWLWELLKTGGATVTGGGIGCGQADVDIELDGFRYNVIIRPLPKVD